MSEFWQTSWPASYYYTETQPAPLRRSKKQRKRRERLASAMLEALIIGAEPFYIRISPDGIPTCEYSARLAVSFADALMVALDEESPDAAI